MNHNQVGHDWNQNADVWTRLARAGYDVHRDHLNTPAFLDMLPHLQDAQVVAYFLHSRGRKPVAA